MDDVEKVERIAYYFTDGPGEHHHSKTVMTLNFLRTK